MVFESLIKRSKVDVVYIDLAKAFDTVNNDILLKPLEAFGFGEPHLTWFGSFLTNIQQCVKIFGVKSKIFSAMSGVPHGGYLSHILFTLVVSSVRLLCELKIALIVLLIGAIRYDLKSMLLNAES